MRSAHHTPRRAHREIPGRALCGLLAIVGVVAFCAPAARAAVDRVPEAAVAIEAFHRLDVWVRAWVAPPDPSLDPNRVECTGAAVTLRLGGRVLGRGTSVVGDGADMNRAALEAWREAASRLKVDSDDADADTDRTETLAHRVTIELEFAGPMTPLDGATFDDAVAATSWGQTGYAMRVGDKIRAMFPGVQMGTGLTPSRALRAAAGALDLPPIELGELRANSGAVPLKFDTVHLAQIEPSDPPTFLHRGGRVVPNAEITGDGLRAAAAALARHLRENAWPDGGEKFGMRGDYHAVSGQYDPSIASPRSQALAALALARYSLCPGIDPESSSEALDRALAILDALRVVEPSEVDPATDRVAMAISAAVCPLVTDMRPDADHAIEIRGFGLKAAGLTRTMPDTADDDTGPTVEELAVAAWALAQLGAQSGDLAQSDREGAEALLSRVVRRSGAEGLISVMPWTAWAIMDLSPTGPVPQSVALRTMREEIWAHQIGDSVMTTPDLDLQGGIVLGARDAGRPTAATIRVISALPAMLADTRMTDGDEVVTELARLRRSLRFVVQLSFSPEACYLARNKDRAVGGVRPTLWDPVASLDPTSMALLTITDTLRAVRVRSGK